MCGCEGDHLCTDGWLMSALPTDCVPQQHRYATASRMVLINSIGNLAGFEASHAVGF